MKERLQLTWLFKKVNTKSSTCVLKVKTGFCQPVKFKILAQTPSAWTKSPPRPRNSTTTASQSPRKKKKTSQVPSQFPWNRAPSLTAVPASNPPKSSTWKALITTPLLQKKPWLLIAVISQNNRSLMQRIRLGLRMIRRSFSMRRRAGIIAWIQVGPRGINGTGECTCLKMLRIDLRGGGLNRKSLEKIWSLFSKKQDRLLLKELVSEKLIMKMMMEMAKKTILRLNMLMISTHWCQLT